MSRKYLFLIFSIVLTAPLLASAQALTIEGMVTSIVNVTLFIASAIVIILWVITGILFLTAQGAPEKLNKAKIALFASVAGTIIIIAANSALALVWEALTF